MKFVKSAWCNFSVHCPKYNAWVVTDVYVLTFPQNPMESVIQVKQGSQRYSLYFTQDGGLIHEKDISNGDDTNWPPTE